jgi:hypothetical protein
MNCILLNKEQAVKITGIYSSYTAIKAFSVPDGSFIVPVDCLNEPTFKNVKADLEKYIVDNGVVDVLDMPDQGGLCEKGKIYNYTPNEVNRSMGLVKCEQTHNRTEHAIETIPALFSFFRKNSDTLEWITNEYVEVGWKRIYQVIQYEVIQAHQTQITWNPIATLGVLWRSLAPPTGEWKVGVAYKINDVVMYLGKKYKCRQSHTSQVGWQPPNVPALWLLI